MLFKWFENRINPFPEEEPTQPPKGFLRFVGTLLKAQRPIY